MKKFFNVKELAARWHISTNTLKKWRFKNKGPKFSKISAKISYLVEDVEEFEKNRDKEMEKINQASLSHEHKPGDRFE
jgi:hypothetical protein